MPRGSCTTSENRLTRQPVAMLFVKSSIASLTCLLPLPDVLALEEMDAEGEHDNLAGWYAGAGVARLVSSPPLLFEPSSVIIGFMLPQELAGPGWHMTPSLVVTDNGVGFDATVFLSSDRDADGEEN